MDTPSRFAIVERGTGMHVGKAETAPAALRKSRAARRQRDKNGRHVNEIDIYQLVVAEEEDPQ